MDNYFKDLNPVYIYTNINELQLDTFKLERLYRTTDLGLLLVWQIGFDGNEIVRLKGNINTFNVDYYSMPPTTHNTLCEQAVVHCKERYINKLRSGYSIQGTHEPPKPKAMKGYLYKRGCLSSNRNNSQITHYLVDNKLDGMRLTCKLVGLEVIFKTYSNVSFRHHRFIIDECREILNHLPINTILDGEMYCHEYDNNFNSIIGVNIINEHPDLGLFSYNLFDIYHPDDLPSEERYEQLKLAYNICNIEEFTHVVINHKTIVDNEDDIEVIFQLAIENNFEGVCIRYTSYGAETTSARNLSLYKFSKCNRLWKYKRTFDDEATVIDVLPCSKTQSHLGKLKVTDSYNVVYTIIGRVTHEERERWLCCKEDYIGRICTVQYERRYKTTNIPQKPIFIRWRDYE